ncbi:MAG TPA: Asp-tRNA(Asn)/Glu-tRNA(Gln) amidotransferase subunit GatB [archaeon]|nr:Asp-tRNA(Asn)/Glu-tRNA(Gln) amidotransferase subunit GatB [archaeon]
MEGKIKIGLETHVQLNTRTKLFCGCSLEKLSEAEPNARTCETCLGMPGSKPRLNKGAVEVGIKIATALGCKLPAKMFFSRKIYLYPDMSKNFQITQYEIPIASAGAVESVDETGKRKIVEISRMNLEEDPAKIQHVGGNITTARYTLIDYNRSGVPLCEIVTAPIFKSPREARIYLQRLMAILRYINAFVEDEFALKTDANISIEGGERVEVKNITGFREVEKALAYEIVRQRSLVRKGEKISQETRTWDADAKVTRPLRKKETAEDYGYIFEPDLRMIALQKEWIEKIRKNLPELPHQKAERYQKNFKLSKELAAALTSDLEVAQSFESAAKKEDPQLCARWVELLRKTLFHNDISLAETKLKLEQFLELLHLVKKKSLEPRAAEMILREIIFTPDKFDSLVKKYSKLSEKNISEIIAKVLRDEKSAVAAYKSGDKKVLDFLIGQVQKASDLRTDAKVVKTLIKKKLAG